MATVDGSAVVDGGCERLWWMAKVDGCWWFRQLHQTNPRIVTPLATPTDTCLTISQLEAECMWLGGWDCGWKAVTDGYSGWVCCGGWLW